MRHQILMTAIAVAWLFSPWQAPVQGEPLVSLIREAVSNSGDIQATRHEILGLEAEADYAKALPNPKLGLGVLNLPVDGFAFDQEPMTQKLVSITQRFPWPGKRSLASDTRQLSAQKGEARFRAQLLSLQRGVSEAYHELWFVGESIRVNEELSMLVTQAIYASESRYSAGRGMQQTVLKAELELSRLADDALALKSRYRMLETQINGLLQRESYRGVVPDAPSGPPVIRPAQTWITEALVTNPKLDQLEQSVALGQAFVALAEKEAMPDVDIKVAYGQRDDDPQGNSRDDFVSLSASFPLPIWKGNRENRLIASKRAGERAAFLNYQGYQRALPHRIEGLATDLETSVNRYLYYKEDLVPRAKQISMASVSRYEVGKADYDDMIDSVMDAMRGELMACQFLRNAWVADAKLNEIAGQIAPEIWDALSQNNGAKIESNGGSHE